MFLPFKYYPKIGLPSPHILVITPDKRIIEMAKLKILNIISVIIKLFKLLKEFALLCNFTLLISFKIESVFFVLKHK